MLMHTLETITALYYIVSLCFFLRVYILLYPVIFNKVEIAVEKDLGPFLQAEPFTFLYIMAHMDIFNSDSDL